MNEQKRGKNDIYDWGDLVDQYRTGSASDLQTNPEYIAYNQNDEQNCPQSIDIESAPDYILSGMHTGDFGSVRKKSPKGTGLKIAGVCLMTVALIAVGQLVLGIITGAAYYHVPIAALDFYPLLPRFTAACILLIAGAVFYAVGRRRIRQSNLASGQSEASAAAKTQPGPWTCPKCGMQNEDALFCQWCKYELKPNQF